MHSNNNQKNRFERIHDVIDLIPKGRVSSYGDIAAFTGGVTARHVGYALSNAPDGLPWHRVVNSQGAVSLRGSDAMVRQRNLLEEEGVSFNDKDQINWQRFGWEGPSLEWFLDRGEDVEMAIATLSKVSERHERQSRR